MTEHSTGLLDSARLQLGLSQADLWTHYFELGGMSSALDVEAFLAGILEPSDHDHDLIALALNECFADLGQEHLVPYVADEPGEISASATGRPRSESRSLGTSIVGDGENSIFGADVTCADGNSGSISGLVIDPVAQVMTHLMVEAKSGHWLGRLIPLEMLEIMDGQIQTQCTVSELEQLAFAEESQAIPGSNNLDDVDGHLPRWPSYGLGMLPGIGMVIYDTLSLSDGASPGEAATDRLDDPRASDGPIGRVQALVVEPRTRHVTHVLLQAEHLSDRKQLAIPITSVVGVDDEIWSNFAKEGSKDVVAP